MSPPVLVGLRALKLGDFCSAVPAWKALRRAHPDHRLVLAAPAWQQPLVDLCPAIDHLEPTEALRALPAPLTGADLAVNLHGRGPESSSLLAAARPRRMVAFRHEAVPETARGPAWRPDEHEVDRWLRLARTAGADPAPDDRSLEVPTSAPVVDVATVVHPGASASARCWPVDRWSAVVRALSAAGHRVVVTGTAAEVARTDAVVEGAGPARATSLAGRTDVGELASLVSRARLVVSGDTGVAHLAYAYRRPSVTLFGPVSPALWGPPSTGPHAALWAGRSGDPHGSTTDLGLLAISVADVVRAADEVAGATAAG